MKKKARFNPEITRVKLNPEQAVLACSCYANGNLGVGVATPGTGFCQANTRVEARNLRAGGSLQAS